MCYVCPRRQKTLGTAVSRLPFSPFFNTKHQSHCSLFYKFEQTLQNGLLSVFVVTKSPLTVRLFNNFNSSLELEKNYFFMFDNNITCTKGCKPFTSYTAENHVIFGCCLSMQHRLIYFLCLAGSKTVNQFTSKV